MRGHICHRAGKAAVLDRAGIFERRARADRLKTEKARRKALRSERKDFAPGTRVAVEGVPSLAGMVGTISKGRGATASIDFGGRFPMQVEAWQVYPVALNGDEAHAGLAA